MKKPVEIKKGLAHCSEEGCKHCPYEDDCMLADGCSDLSRDALAYIQKLEAQAGKDTNVPRWISVEEGYPKSGSDIYAVVYRPEHIDEDGKHRDAERMVHSGNFRRVLFHDRNIDNRWWTLTERDGTEFVIKNEVSESEYEGGFSEHVTHWMYHKMPEPPKEG